VMTVTGHGRPRTAFVPSAASTGTHAPGSVLVPESPEHIRDTAPKPAEKQNLGNVRRNPLLDKKGAVWKCDVLLPKEQSNAPPQKPIPR
jgi:hypothetical protein